jgi:hypothetical protein
MISRQRIIATLTIAALGIITGLAVAACERTADYRIQINVFMLDKPDGCKCKADVNPDTTKGETNLETVTITGHGTLASSANAKTPYTWIGTVPPSTFAVGVQAKATDLTKILGATIKVDGTNYITCIGTTPGYVDCATDLDHV